MLDSERYRGGGTVQDPSILLYDRLASGERGVCSASYRRPHVNLKCIDHRAGFDRGLTSSYSRAG